MNLRNKIKYHWNTIKNTPSAVIMCIRFPFLYPRNMWTGKHYNNRKLQNKYREIYDKYHIFRTEDRSANGGSRFEIVENRWDSKRWKFVYNCLKYLEKFIAIFHIIPTHSLHTWIPDGWRKAFGTQMWKEVRHELYKSGGWKAVYSFRITDIKEKWGALQVYVCSAPANVYKVLQKYEYISTRTCIVCGELATCETPIEYWKCPYCDKHAPKQSKFLLDFGLYNSWYGYTGNINQRSLEILEEKKKMIENYKNLQM